VTVNKAKCFLCGSTMVKRTRNRRPVNFNENRYFYKCKDCKGYSLWPKLENWEISKLYSMNYIGDVAPESLLDYESNKARFKDLELYLTKISDRNEKLYLDFGCGSSADTIIFAKSLGFQAFGVEVAEDTRKQAKKISGCRIYAPEEMLKHKHEFDIVFMGDVLEHAVDPILVLESVKKSLKPGGVLVIQGPLEAAITLSNILVSLKAQIFFNHPSTFPPYHVSLASRKSILKMLRVLGLIVIEMEITEPYWPATQFGSRDSFTSPSIFILSLTKLIDIGLNKINNSYGTRFFLIAKSGSF
jgi:SAM-dependent methyltransferase